MGFKNQKNWEYKTISEISEIVTDYVANGSFASLKEHTEYVDRSKYILIRLVDHNNNFSGEFKYITEESYNFLSKTKLYGGEMIISNVGANAGTVFKVPYLDYNMSLGPNSILVKTKYNDGFYYYWFISEYGQYSLNSITAGSAQPKFNKTDFRKLKVPVPCLEEQNSIFDFLNLLDQKIEVNNKIIANLESQAQAIFKSWFIDFEPFQDGEFVESELGMIPKGWEVTTIGEISKRINGYSYKSSDLADVSKYNMVTLKNFNRNGDMPNDVIKPISLNDRIKDRHFLLENDILVACTDLTQAAEVIGRVLLYSMNEKFDNEIFSMDLVKLVPNSELERLFLYYYLKSPMFKDYAEGVATGTTVLHLPKNAIDNFTVVRPNLYGIELFNKTISPFIELQKVLYKQNQKLAETRDTLLPKLMSGEIDVSNIKINIEENNND